MTDVAVAARRLVSRAMRGVGVRRQHVAVARLACERQVLSAIGRRRTKPGGRILCYHSLGQPELFGVNDVSPARFAAQLHTALELGFRFVPAATIAAGAGGPRDLAVTFDDSAVSVLTRAAPVLAELGIPADLFVVTSWTDGVPGLAAPDGYLDWDQVVGLAETGIAVGSHTVTHRNPGTLGRGELADELGVSREVIAARTGLLVDTLAIPYGQSGNWPAFGNELAATAGYGTVYAQAEQTRAAGTVARTFVTAHDDPRVFRGLLRGTFDRWEEWF